MNTFRASFLLLHSISASLNQTVDCINKLLNTWDISIMFCVFLALKSVGEEDMSKIKVTFQIQLYVLTVRFLVMFYKKKFIVIIMCYGAYQNHLLFKHLFSPHEFILCFLDCYRSITVADVHWS